MECSNDFKDSKEDENIEENIKPSEDCRLLISQENAQSESSQSTSGETAICDQEKLLCQKVQNSVNENQQTPENVLPVPNQSIARPSFDFNQQKMITGAWNEFTLKNRQQVFLKGCKWSPDGTCLLTNSDDAAMRLFDFPPQLFNCYYLPDCDIPELKPSLRCKVGGLIYDYDWYPLMASYDPATCCFVTTSFCAPVQMWDAYSGTLRCSYRGYNAQDELHAALSAVFQPSGDLLLCGYKDCVKIFSTDVPGRNFSTISTKNLCEQRGIVSCIAVNPSMPNIFAAGSYMKTVGLYSTDGHAMCLMMGQGGGLTQLKFSQDGSQLFTAARKDPEMLCWDLRNLGKILYVMKRPHSTNQRIYFDLSNNDQFLLSGSSDGHVYVWDLQAALTTPIGSENSVLEPLTRWRAHNDCVNGLSIHRYFPIVASASGQRFCPEIIDEDNDDDSVFSTDRPRDKCEDSVKLWWTGKAAEENGVN